MTPPKMSREVAVPKRKELRLYLFLELPLIYTMGCNLWAQPSLSHRETPEHSGLILDWEETRSFA